MYLFVKLMAQYCAFDDIFFEKVRFHRLHDYMKTGFSNISFGYRFKKIQDTAVKYARYVSTQAVFVKKNLLFHDFWDKCGQGLSL